MGEPVRIEGHDSNQIADVDTNQKALKVRSCDSSSNLMVTSRDTSFVLGDSPATVDVNAALGYNGAQFVVYNDGAGDIDVDYSIDGVSYSNKHRTKTGEAFELKGISVDSIRLTHVADSSYRVVAL